MNNDELNEIINAVAHGKSESIVDKILIKQLLEHGKDNIVKSWGSWTGDGQYRDIEEDIINMIYKLDRTTDPKYLILPKCDEKLLYICDSERNTILSKINRLFGLKKNDTSFIIKSENMPVGLAALYGSGKENFPNLFSVVLINTRGKSPVTEYGRLSKWVYEQYDISE